MATNPHMHISGKSFADLRKEHHRGYSEIATLAAIPENYRAAFRNDMDDLMFNTERDAMLRNRRYKDDAALESASRKVRDAYDAIRGLSRAQRIAIGFGLSSPSGPLPPKDSNDWNITTPNAASEYLLRLVAAFGGITGHSPYFEKRKGRGRPSGAETDWPLTEFIRRFSQTITKSKGQLSHYRGADNALRGKLADALEILRPMLHPDLLPKKLPAQTILKAFLTNDD